MFFKELNVNRNEYLLFPPLTSLSNMLFGWRWVIIGIVAELFILAVKKTNEI